MSRFFLHEQVLCKEKYTNTVSWPCSAVLVRPTACIELNKINQTGHLDVTMTLDNAKEIINKSVQMEPGLGQLQVKGSEDLGTMSI